MDGSAVRNLLRRATTATLSTLDAATGHPYGSLVEVATMPDARPLLLLSALARHTGNLKADDRVSLLVDQRRTSANPMATERATIIGKARPLDDPTARHRYLSRFPAAGAYAEFADFGFWVVEMSVAHAIGGFGRIREIAAASVMLDQSSVAPLAAAETNLLARVNSRLEAAGRAPRHDRRAVGFDIEGIDIIGSEGIERLPWSYTRGNREDCFEAIACTIARAP